MWTRKEIKRNARHGLKKNYWTMVIVCFFLALFCNEHSSSTDGITAENGSEVDYEELDSYSYAVDDADNYSIVTDITGIDGDSEDEEDGELNTAVSNSFNDFTQNHDVIFSLIGATGATLTGSFLKALILAAAGLGTIAFTAFIAWPLQVGGMRYCLDVCEGIEGLKARVMLCMYRKGIYINTIRVMFFKWLQGTLWWFTIIGGVIKYYEYRMIPYLLAENPGLKRKEAFRLAREMMRGNKWKLFLLDMSFIGWILLTAVSFGLVGLFYAGPYQSLTDAQFYQVIRDEAVAKMPELFQPITESTF